jgi:hypothetical protein
MATRRLNRNNINPCYHNFMEAGRPGRRRQHQQHRCSNGQWKPSFNSRAVTPTAYQAQSDNHVHHLAIGAAVAARTVTATVTVTSVLVAVSIVVVIPINVKTAIVTATVTTNSATVAATGAAAAAAMAAVTGAVAVRTTPAAGAGLLHRVVYNQSVRRPTRQFVVAPHTERLSILRRR